MEANLDSKKQTEALSIIKQINSITDHNWVFTKFSNSIWWLLEIICYVMIIILIGIIFYLPSGEIFANQQITEGISVEAKLTISQLVTFFWILKVTLFILGIMTFLMSRIIKRIRKRKNLLEEINNLSSKFLKQTRNPHDRL
jgi:ABC-type multidrug transport system fused ATPase/permease subunit